MKKIAWFVVLVFIVAGLYFLKPSNTNKVIQNSLNNGISGENSPTKVMEESNSSFPLEILSPTNGSTVSATPVVVSGKTAPYADVFVNENELKADGSGSFSTTYELLEGENIIYITVNDNFGNYTEKAVTINLTSK